jgi:hypothetical protein
LGRELTWVTTAIGRGGQDTGTGDAGEARRPGDLMRSRHRLSKTAPAGDCLRGLVACAAVPGQFGGDPRFRDFSAVILEQFRDVPAVSPCGNVTVEIDDQLLDRPLRSGSLDLDLSGVRRRLPDPDRYGQDAVGVAGADLIGFRACRR